MEGVVKGVPQDAVEEKVVSLPEVEPLPFNLDFETPHQRPDKDGEGVLQQGFIQPALGGKYQLAAEEIFDKRRKRNRPDPLPGKIKLKGPFLGADVKMPVDPHFGLPEKITD